jgi:competence protein ComEA
VYRIRAGGRVSDVIDAAGGPAADAPDDPQNQAAKVSDGDRVLVPRRGETLPGAGVGGDVGGGSASGPLNVNTATADQLEELPGVGPATAQAIVDHRRQHGRFRSVEELLDVRGTGEAKLAALRPRVRV